MSTRTDPIATDRSSDGTLRRFVAALFSFEVVFALFLYSNHFKFFVADVVPVDETLLLFLLSVPAGAWVVLHRGLYLPGLATVVAGLLFFAWVGLSWTWSPSHIMALQELSLLFTGGLWSLLAGALVIAPERKRVARFLLISAILGVAVASSGWIYRALYGDLVLSTEWRRLGFSAIYQLWGQMSALGGLAALAFAASAPFLSSRQVIFLTFAIFTLSFVPAAGSRLALVGTAAGIVLLLFFLPARIGRGHLHLSYFHLLVPFLLATIAIVMLPAEHSASLSTLNRFRSMLTDAELYDGILQRHSRVYYLSAALRLWLSAPLNGIGIMGFSPSVFFSEMSGTHPHNILIQILTETGFIGLALFGLFLWVAHRRVTPRRLHEDRLLLAVLGVGMVPWAIALFSESLGIHWKLYAFLGLLTLPPPAVEAAPAAAPPRGPVARPPRVVH